MVSFMSGRKIQNENNEFDRFSYQNLFYQLKSTVNSFIHMRNFHEKNLSQF